MRAEQRTDARRAADEQPTNGHWAADERRGGRGVSDLPSSVPGMQMVQGTLDDLGTPLHEVTFVVVDLETTGGSPT